MPDEYVNPDPIPDAVANVAESQLKDSLNPAAESLLNRKAPPGLPAQQDESTTDFATRVGRQMNGDCLVIQGPPGTGKTYTASHMIAALLADGKKIGITSNGHKAIMNLVKACGGVLSENGRPLVGVKAGDSGDEQVFEDNPGFLHRKTGGEAYEAYSDGIIAGTAWLFRELTGITTLTICSLMKRGRFPLRT